MGLRIERHLDEVGFQHHVIAPYKVMKTPPWKLIVPTVCIDLCKSMKSNTDRLLYCLYYSDCLESFTEYTHIFTDGSKDGDKTDLAFICPSFEFSKCIHEKASNFTAELEAQVSALRYITSTNKRNKSVILVTQNLYYMPCCRENPTVLMIVTGNQSSHALINTRVLKCIYVFHTQTILMSSIHRI